MFSSKNLNEMNELLEQVTPLTKAVLWLTKEEVSPSQPVYKGLDYLLDGLLTASLISTNLETSLVIVGKNFGNPLYVFVARTLPPKELESFLGLLKPVLLPENDILVIDEMDEVKNLQKRSPDEIKKKYRMLK